MNRPINIIGGDNRDLYLGEILKDRGYNITLWGYDKVGYNKYDLDNLISNNSKTIKPIFIFPMSGTNENGHVVNKYSTNPIVIDHAFFKKLVKGSRIIIGYARKWFKQYCDRYNIELVEVAENDEIAILNSIPSAEGAIQMAMENSEITIHNSTSLVMGLGRCGQTLARMLKGLDSKVYVYARNNISLARAFEMGFIPVDSSQLDHALTKIDIIYNTVPALILTKERLDYCLSCEVIIDMASAPGGVDFEYAKAQGIKAILAPGLPGIVAPKTAAEILAKVYPKFLGGEINNEK